MLKSPTSLQPEFDWQQLRQLAGEDPDFEAELLSIFLKDAKSRLKALGAAIEAHDAAAVEEIAHSLRGASANVGASALARSAQQLEHAARTGQMDSTAALLTQLHDYCQRLQARISLNV